MDIYLWQDGSQTGPFSDSDIVARLESRQLNSSCLAWTDGMEGWVPLSDWNIARPDPPPPLPMRPASQPPAIPTSAVETGLSTAKPAPAGFWIPVWFWWCFVPLLALCGIAGFQRFKELAVEQSIKGQISTMNSSKYQERKVEEAFVRGMFGDLSTAAEEEAKADRINSLNRDNFFDLWRTYLQLGFVKLLMAGLVLGTAVLRIPRIPRRVMTITSLDGQSEGGRLVRIGLVVIVAVISLGDVVLSNSVEPLAAAFCDIFIYPVRVFAGLALLTAIGTRPLTES